MHMCVYMLNLFLNATQNYPKGQLIKANLINQWEGS